MSKLLQARRGHDSENESTEGDSDDSRSYFSTSDDSYDEETDSESELTDSDGDSSEEDSEEDYTEDESTKDEENDGDLDEDSLDELNLVRTRTEKEKNMPEYRRKLYKDPNSKSEHGLFKDDRLTTRTGSTHRDLSEHRYASRGKGGRSDGTSRYSRFSNTDSDFETREPISNAWATVTPESLLSWKDFADTADQKPTTTPQPVTDAQSVTKSLPVVSLKPEPAVSSEPVTSSNDVTILEPITEPQHVVSLGQTSVDEQTNNVPEPSISAWGSINRQEEASIGMHGASNWGSNESNNWKTQSWEPETTPIQYNSQAGLENTTLVVNDAQAAPQWATLVLNASRDTDISKDVKQRDNIPTPPKPQSTHIINASSQQWSNTSAPSTPIEIPSTNPTIEETVTETAPERTRWGGVTKAKVSNKVHPKDLPTEIITWNDFSTGNTPKESTNIGHTPDACTPEEDNWNNISVELEATTHHNHVSAETLTKEETQWNNVSGESASKETTNSNHLSAPISNEKSNWGEISIKDTTNWNKTINASKEIPNWTNISVEKTIKETPQSIESTSKKSSNWNDASNESGPKKTTSWNVVSADTPKERTGWNNVSADTPKERTGWHNVSADTHKETTGWNNVSVDTPKESTGWGDVSADIPKESTGWGNPSNNTTKETTGWKDTYVESTPKVSSSRNTAINNLPKESKDWNAPLDNSVKPAESVKGNNSRADDNRWNRRTNDRGFNREYSARDNWGAAVVPEKHFEKPAVIQSKNKAIPAEERASSSWAQMSAEALPVKVYSKPAYKPTWNRNKVQQERGPRKHESIHQQSPIQQQDRKTHSWNSNQTTPVVTPPVAHPTISNSKTDGWSDKKSSRVEKPVEKSCGATENSAETASWDTTTTPVQHTSWKSAEMPVEISLWTPVDKSVDTPAEKSSWATTENPAEINSWATSEGASTSWANSDDAGATWSTTEKSTSTTSWDKSAEKGSWASTERPNENPLEKNTWAKKSPETSVLAEEFVEKRSWSTNNKTNSPRITSLTSQTNKHIAETPSVHIAPAATSGQSSWSVSPAMAESSTTWNIGASSEERPVKAQGGWGGDIRSNGWSTSQSNSSTNWNDDKKAANQARQNNYSKPGNGRGYLSQRVEKQSVPAEDYHRGDEDSDVEIILEADEESDWVKNEQILGMTAPEEELKSAKPANNHARHNSNSSQAESINYRKNYSNTSRKPRRNFEDNWRQRDEVNSDIDEHPKYHQQQQFHHQQHHGVPMYYPQPHHSQMNGGNMPYLPMIPNGPNGSPIYAMSYPMGIPSSATGSISPNNSVGGDSSPHVNHAPNFYPPMINGPNGFQLPPGYEANGMVYYGMDPAAMYAPPPPQPFYFYAPMSMNAPPVYSPQHHHILPEHRMIDEEDIDDDDDGWGPSPEIVEEQWGS